MVWDDALGWVATAAETARLPVTPSSVLPIRMRPFHVPGTDHAQLRGECLVWKVSLRAIGIHARGAHPGACQRACQTLRIDSTDDYYRNERLLDIRNRFL